MGTLYSAIYPSAQSDPTAADIKAGTVANGFHSSIASPEVTTLDFEGTTITGLTAGESYRHAVVWDDGTDTSDVEVSDAFVASVVIDASGVVVSGPAQMSGDFYREVKNTGSLVSGSSAMAGVLSRVVTLNGALTSALSQIGGSLGIGGTASLSGTLQSGAASMSGTLKRTIKATGNLSSGDSSVSGVNEREVTASGSLTSNSSIVLGAVAVNGEEPEFGRPYQSIKISTGRQS